jgi:hypothetical protein
MANELIRINPRTEVLEDTNVFTRVWYRFMESVQDVVQLVRGETSTSAVAGGAVLPATPEGFISIQIKGVTYKVPYYK